jgi:hypothetical protein
MTTMMNNEAVVMDNSHQMMNTNEAIVLDKQWEMITYGWNVWKDVMIIYNPTFTLLDEITWLKQNYINNDIRMVKKIFDNCHEGEGLSYNIEFDKVDDIEEGEEKDDDIYYLYKCNGCKWITSDDDPVCEMCNKTGMMMVEATPAIYDDTDCDEDEE